MTPSARIPNRSWRPRSGRTRSVIGAEQDRAAGGFGRRWVEVGGVVSLGSVVLRPNSRQDRLYAYLRWPQDGKSRSTRLGVVDRPTRRDNLAEGWELVRAAGLVTDPPKEAGSWASTPAVRESMKGNRGRDTTPELRLRSSLHARGLRYRVSTRAIPGVRRTVDVVFPRVKVAVFVDGCFWHGCPEHYRPANTNSEFWRDKIEGNRRRDADTDRILAESGWAVVRVWEHQDPESAADQVASVVSGRLDHHR